MPTASVKQLCGVARIPGFLSPCPLGGLTQVHSFCHTVLQLVMDSGPTVLAEREEKACALWGGQIYVFIVCLFSFMLRLQQLQLRLQLIGYSRPRQEMTFDPSTTLPLIKGHAIAQLCAGSGSASGWVRSLPFLNWSKIPVRSAHL